MLADIAEIGCGEAGADHRRAGGPPSAGGRSRPQPLTARMTGPMAYSA
jgi:hypothetical protein